MRPMACGSDGKVWGSMETLAAEFPYEGDEGRILGFVGVQGRAGTTGTVAAGPAMMATSLEGTLTGRESQDSPWADMVRTVSSWAVCRDWI